MVHNISDGHRLSYFIGNICAAYTRYYKAKYSTGKGKMFFECRFKAKEIIDEEYLQQCIYYVENNPIKHGIVENNDEWLYRSYTSWEEEGNNILDLEKDLEK